MVDSSGTFTTNITVDLPDFVSENVSFINRNGAFVSGNEEIFPLQTYTLTLDSSGQGTQALPCPDNTGTLAINWAITFPNKRRFVAAIAFDASDQALSDILAAVSTTTAVDSVIATLAGKQAVDVDAIAGNLAFFDSDGNTVDSSIPASWNAADQTMNIPVSDEVTIQVGQEVVVLVRNESGNTIVNGAVVKLTGTTGARLTAELAQADSTTNARQIGIVTEEILNNATGFITMVGLVRDLNTSAYNEGDTIYLSTTVAGAFTNTAPTYPDIVVPVGVVVTKNASTGVIFATSYETSSEAYSKAVAVDTPSVNVLGDLGGGTDDIDLDDGRVISATVSTAEQTFTFSNPVASGSQDHFTLYLTNGGSQVVNWPASVDWAGGGAPGLTAAGLDILTFKTIDSGTLWVGHADDLDVK